MTKRAAYVLFSDDVRYEVGNKRSFIGVYGTQCFLPSFPIVVPRICVTTTLICQHGDFPERLSVRVSFNKQTIHAIDVPKEDLISWVDAQNKELEPELDEFAGEEPPKARFAVEFVISPFAVNEPGRLCAHIETERETIRAGSIYIGKGTPEIMASANPGLRNL